MADDEVVQVQVEVQTRTTPYRGYMRLDIYKLRHQVFDRGWSEEVSREVLERGHAVAVLPYDPGRDEVVLLEQFRIGAYTAPSMSPWQIECVAGMIEPYQTAEQAAVRETEEEAGAAILEIEHRDRFAAATLPRRTIPCNSSRSSSVNRTTYLAL